VGAQARGDLGADLRERGVQEVDVGQLPGHQEPLVLAEASGQGALELRQLGAEAPLRQLGQGAGVRRAGQQGRQHLAPRHSAVLRTGNIMSSVELTHYAEASISGIASNCFEAAAGRS
jgi:hypothetical protein